MQNKQELNLEQINLIRQQGLRPVIVGCIINDQKLLMVYKEKYNLWFLPQGGIKNEESVSQAIKREMIEELGQSFFDNCQTDFIFLSANQVNFPSKHRGSRDLFTDQGAKIFMKGKKYLFYMIKSDQQDVDITQTEFNDYQWVNYEQGKALAEKIYQKGKKRITLDIMEKLKNNKIIN